MLWYVRCHWKTQPGYFWPVSVFTFLNTSGIKYTWHPISWCLKRLPVALRMQCLDTLIKHYVCAYPTYNACFKLKSNAEMLTNEWWVGCSLFVWNEPDFPSAKWYSALPSRSQPALRCLLWWCQDQLIKTESRLVIAEISESEASRGAAVQTHPHPPHRPHCPCPLLPVDLSFKLSTVGSDERWSDVELWWEDRVVFIFFIALTALLTILPYHSYFTVEATVRYTLSSLHYLPNKGVIISTCQRRDKMEI